MKQKCVCGAEIEISEDELKVDRFNQIHQSWRTKHSMCDIYRVEVTIPLSEFLTRALVQLMESRSN